MAEIGRRRRVAAEGVRPGGRVAPELPLFEEVFAHRRGRAKRRERVREARDEVHEADGRERGRPALHLAIKAVGVGQPKLPVHHVQRNRRAEPLRRSRVAQFRTGGAERQQPIGRRAVRRAVVVRVAVGVAILVVRVVRVERDQAAPAGFLSERVDAPVGLRARVAPRIHKRAVDDRIARARPAGRLRLVHFEFVDFGVQRAARAVRADERPAAPELDLDLAARGRDRQIHEHDRRAVGVMVFEVRIRAAAVEDDLDERSPAEPRRHVDDRPVERPQKRRVEAVGFVVAVKTEGELAQPERVGVLAARVAAVVWIVKLDRERQVRHFGLHGRAVRVRLALAMGHHLRDERLRRIAHERAAVVGVGDVGGRHGVGDHVDEAGRAGVAAARRGRGDRVDREHVGLLPAHDGGDLARAGELVGQELPAFVAAEHFVVVAGQALDQLVAARRHIDATAVERAAIERSVGRVLVRDLAEPELLLAVVDARLRGEAVDRIGAARQRRVDLPGKLIAVVEGGQQAAAAVELEHVGVVERRVVDVVLLRVERVVHQERAQLAARARVDLAEVDLLPVFVGHVVAVAIGAQLPAGGRQARVGAEQRPLEAALDRLQRRRNQRIGPQRVRGQPAAAAQLRLDRLARGAERGQLVEHGLVGKVHRRAVGRVAQPVEHAHRERRAPAGIRRRRAGRRAEHQHSAVGDDALRHFKSHVALVALVLAREKLLLRVGVGQRDVIRREHRAGIVRRLHRRAADGVGKLRVEAERGQVGIRNAVAVGVEARIARVLRQRVEQCLRRGVDGVLVGDVAIKQKRADRAAARIAGIAGGGRRGRDVVEQQIGRRDRRRQSRVAHGLARGQPARARRAGVVILGVIGAHGQHAGDIARRDAARQRMTVCIQPALRDRAQRDVVHRVDDLLGLLAGGDLSQAQSIEPRQRDVRGQDDKQHRQQTDDHQQHRRSPSLGKPALHAEPFSRRAAALWASSTVQPIVASRSTLPRFPARLRNCQSGKRLAHSRQRPRIATRPGEGKRCRRPGLPRRNVFRRQWLWRSAHAISGRLRTVASEKSAALPRRLLLSGRAGVRKDAQRRGRRNPLRRRESKPRPPAGRVAENRAGGQAEER